MSGGKKLFVRYGTLLSVGLVIGTLLLIFGLEDTERAEPMLLALILSIQVLGGFVVAASAVFVQRPLIARMTRFMYERCDDYEHRPGWRFFSWLYKIDRYGNYEE